MSRDDDRAQLKRIDAELRRVLDDDTTLGTALTVLDVLRLLSLHAGRRLSLDDALPGWSRFDWLVRPVAALQVVGLLDVERRITERFWDVAVVETWEGDAIAEAEWIVRRAT